MQKFDGIWEKLRRAKENIRNLEKEISTFFQEGDYPVLPDKDRELILKAIEYHKNRIIPPRFGVLTGEIIHHLRACFDHVVWHFSIDPIDDIRRIEFPVFDAPLNHGTRKVFERKIQGIKDTNVLSLIKRLQPYNATDPIDDPLWIIHHLDIIDKHRELLYCPPTGSYVFSADMKPIVESYQRAHPELDSAQIARHFKSHGTAMPSISFKEFGRREIQPVVPGLSNLFNYTLEAIKEFETL